MVDSTDPKKDVDRTLHLVRERCPGGSDRFRRRDQNRDHDAA